MNMTLKTRLLSMAVTIFILVLTIKSELLEYQIISWQLVLSIPLLFAALVANSKITNEENFNKYKKFNLLTNSLAIALISNTVGLLITKYVSFLAGLAYFTAFILLYLYLLKIEWSSKKFINELIVIIATVALGLIPALLI